MLCLTLSLMACATQPPIVVNEYEILRLTKKIYVPINKKTDRTDTD